MNENKKYLIVCNCQSCEHQAILSYYPDDKYPMLALAIHLVTWEGFFRRLWVGLKYAFGYRSRYGNFDEILIDKEEAQRINDFFSEIGYLTEAKVVTYSSNDAEKEYGTWTDHENTFSADTY